MKEVAIKNYSELVVTLPPDFDKISAVYNHYEKELNENAPLPPIIVTRSFSNSFLILDGHCRGYLLAVRNRVIRALCLNRAEDQGLLLSLEQRGEIPSFPHLDFLKGLQGINDLRQAANMSARAYSALTMTDFLSCDPGQLKTSTLFDVKIPIDGWIGRRSVACVILYDRVESHTVPLVQKKSRAAKNLGYEVVSIDDPEKLKEGISWARECQKMLDDKLKSLMDI
ncbi:MAG: hypothetical protein MUC65_01655 [Pontiellaceae bacterium]|jgi:hypothetical protein|nr:hypothetical protein [Pontiellaceae bacterium]